MTEEAAALATREEDQDNKIPTATEGRGAVTPMQLLQVAMDQGADLNKLEKLMELQERWEKNEARKAFVKAMADFKEEAVSLIKNRKASFDLKTGGRTEYSYITLDQVCEAVIPALSKHGLAHRWKVEQDEKGAIRVFCAITHEMGHSEETFMSAMPDTSGTKNPIQALGSATTYLQRYTLLSACGLAARDMDDDGHGSGGEPDTITEEQADTLQSLVEEVGADKAKFFTAYNIDSYSELPAKSYDRAVAMLEKKREQAHDAGSD